MTQSMNFGGQWPATRALRQVGAGLLLTLAAATVFAAPTLLAGASPVRNALAGEQSDAGILLGDRPSVSFASVAATVTSVQWWGYDLAVPIGTDDFQIKLNGIALNGAVSAAADSVDIDSGFNVLKYTLDLNLAFIFAAGLGTLGIVNNTDTVEWYWQTSAPNLQSFRLFGEPTVGTVPEPGAMGLALLALSLLAGNRAMRRRD